ncbi:NAD(P)-dependent oxidoreductase [Insolitispirillum peregrinum]|uniref:NAD(P)-dependent oxidoreductase n=1 Tax=Insolitispirillum peregrinum TaxID=80876 RepID=UPI003616141C
MKAILVDCTPELRAVMARRGLIVPAGLTVNDGTPSEDELKTLCQGQEVLLVEHTVVPPSVFDACPSLRHVVYMGTGVGSYIDLADAERRGVSIRIVPGYGDQAVAEHALALLFSAVRNIARMDRDLRAGRWDPIGGTQLKGRRVAVIGLGGIGTTFAGLAQGLGMEVVGWNRTPRDLPWYQPDLRAALRGADVVSLHLSLNDHTRNLLTAEHLALPRAGFVLVNTARAGLVEEGALLAGLASGQIGHAALDVFPQEPLQPGSPYPALENVTLTTHAAYMTEDAYAELWLRGMAVLAEVRG